MLLIVRDIILVICAVISAACLLYIAMNLHTAPEEETNANGTPRATLDQPRQSSSAFRFTAGAFGA